jgi:drug/metabolite transporter, DME family
MAQPRLHDLRDQWSGVLIVLAAASLFGTLGTLSRFAYDAGLTPFAWVAWRATIGAIGLWVVIARRRGIRSLLDGLRTATSTERRWLMLAVVAGALLNLSIFVAFQRTAIALALLAFYTYPAMVAAASAALGHERLDGARVAALGLAIAGMVAVVVGGLGSDAPIAVDALGIALALLAAMCQTVFVVANRGYARIRTEEAMGSILVGSALIAVIATLAFEGPGALFQPLGDVREVLLLGLVGLFAAALPSFMFLTGIRRLGAVRAGILMLFEPVVGVALAAALLGEGIGPLQAAGGATILAAAILVQRRRGVRESTAPVVPAPGGP